MTTPLTGARGVVRAIRDYSESGRWSVFAYSRRAAHPVSVKVDVANGATASIELALDEVQRELKHENKFGEKYRAGDEYRPSH